MSSRPLHLTLHHPHQPRHRLFDLLAFHLIEMVVDIVQECISHVFRHIASIACSDEGDGGKFTGILFCSQMLSTQDSGQHLIQDVTVMQKFREIVVLLEKGIKHFFFVLSQKQKILFLYYLTLEELGQVGSLSKTAHASIFHTPMFIMTI